MNLTTLFQKLERRVPMAMFYRWLESTLGPNRELCLQVSNELRAELALEHASREVDKVSPESADDVEAAELTDAPSAERELGELEMRAVHRFARHSARDAFLLQFLSGPLTVPLVFLWDLRRTETHLSNLAGTMVLLHNPEVPDEQWREDALNYLAGVDRDTTRLRRSARLMRKLLLRGAAQRLATRGLRTVVPRKTLAGRVALSCANGLWAYGEILVAARSAAKAQHDEVNARAGYDKVEEPPSLMVVVNHINPFRHEHKEPGKLYN